MKITKIKPKIIGKGTKIELKNIAESIPKNIVLEIREKNFQQKKENIIGIIEKKFQKRKKNILKDQKLKQ